MNNRVGFAPLLFLFGARIAAQSFVELTDGRNTTNPFASVLLIEAGAIGTLASPEELTRGLEDEFSWDGRAYFRDEAFGSRRGTLEAYAGRDGIFGAYTDGKLVGDATMTRFEVRAQPWQFYRDGFYADEELRPNGFYDGSSYEGYVGFGRDQQGLYIEFGPFYKTFEFKESRLTSPTFTIPEDYAAYGGRLYLEQNTVQMDRRRGMPRDGYALTIIGEREWNDSQGEFGTQGVFETKLPSAVWRVRGRLEWYLPGSDSAIWEVFAHGGWQDELDRVENTQGQRPLGDQWADAQLRLRLHLGRSMTLTPFFHGQYSHVANEFGTSSSTDFFLGGGLESYVHFSESLSMHGWYSYLDNENRPSIQVDNDVHGQQMFYLGMVLHFAVKRR